MDNSNDFSEQTGKKTRVVQVIFGSTVLQHHR